MKCKNIMCLFSDRELANGCKYYYDYEVVGCSKRISFDTYCKILKKTNYADPLRWMGEIIQQQKEKTS